MKSPRLREGELPDAIADLGTELGEEVEFCQQC
jgi:hypothetical protein